MASETENPEDLNFIDTHVVPELEKLFKICKEKGVSIVCRVEMWDEEKEQAIAANSFLPSENITTHQMTLGNILNEEKLHEFAQQFTTMGYERAKQNKSNILLPGQDFQL